MSFSDGLDGLGALGGTTLALLLVLLLLGATLQAPRLVAGAMLAVLFLCASSTWGQLSVENTVYSRGTGIFTLSLLNLALFVSGAAVLLRRLAHPGQASLAPPLALGLAAFTALFAGHLGAALWNGIPFAQALGYTGIVNVLNMLVFAFVLVAAFRDPPAQEKLLRLLLALAAARLAFGLLRYGLGDGDSANPYRNFERIDVKIVFFDIADNFIAALGAFVAAWLLLLRAAPLALWRRAMLLLFLAGELASVALSYRRASLVGLGLMFGFLLLRVRGVRRLWLGLFGAAALAGVALQFFAQRLQFAAAASGNAAAALVYDLGHADGLHGSRMAEWWSAAQSMAHDWILGLGSWGSFAGDQAILDYHFGRFDYIHSGFGHVLLKSGLLGMALFCLLLASNPLLSRLLGMALFCLLLASVAHWYRRHARRLEGRARLLADAGMAGLLFWLPTLFIGTPVIEFRSMLLLGLALALPFLAAAPAPWQMPFPAPLRHAGA